jgi:hypothetical protein
MLGVEVITAAHTEWIFPFTGLQPAQFRRLVRLVAERGGEGIADGRPGGSGPSTCRIVCCWSPPTGART